MKIGLGSMVMGCILGVAALTGCAADASDVEGDGAGGATTPEIATDLETAGTYYTINCGSTLPGLPKPPCYPDLRFTQTLTEVWEPGNSYNIAPGHYIHFEFMNDSLKDAGPFEARVKDYTGATLKTYSFAGLPAGGRSAVVIHAPYECGWVRTAELDTGKTVAEANEGNNTTSQSYYCARP